METIVPGWDWRTMNGALRQAQDERGIEGGQRKYINRSYYSWEPLTTRA